jgi:hypothetical protein
MRPVLTAWCRRTSRVTGRLNLSNVAASQALVREVAFRGMKQFAPRERPLSLTKAAFARARANAEWRRKQSLI